MSRRLYLILAIVLSVINSKPGYSQAINDHMFAAATPKRLQLPGCIYLSAG